MDTERILIEIFNKNMLRNLAIILSLLTLFSLNSIAQVNQNFDTQQQAIRNKWALGMFYSDGGFGLSGTYSTSLGRITDLNFRLSVSGVTDNSEVEYYDYYGNAYTRNKINRVFLSTLSIGIKHNIFFDDIDGNFKPLVKLGIAPSYIMMTPYDKSFFNAFGYAQSSWGIGAYGGIGLEYYESKSIGLGITLDYYYIPVLGQDVYSLKDKKITNVGGFQIGFNFMFLK